MIIKKFMERSLFVLLCLCMSVAVAKHHAHDDHHGHSHGHKSFDTFEKKEGYVITIKSDKVLAPHVKEAKALHVGRSYAEKEEIQHRLSELLPSGTVLRVGSAVETEDGVLEIFFDTEQSLSKSDVMQIDGVKEFKGEWDGVGFVRTVRLEPDSSTTSLPEGWTKESGYTAILQQINSGKEWVKVSIVFANPDNSRDNIRDKPFDAVMEYLSRVNVGQGYGLGYSDKKIGWYTRDINQKILTYLYDSPLVINLVPRSK